MKCQRVENGKSKMNVKWNINYNITPVLFTILHYVWYEEVFDHCSFEAHC